MNELQIFSKNLQNLLKAKGLNNKDLARMLNMTDAAVGKWLLCHNSPTLAIVRKISDIFGVSMADLLEDRGDDPHYFINAETRKLVEELESDSELRSLVLAARDASPDDIKHARDIILLRSKQEGGDEQRASEETED